MGLWGRPAESLGYECFSVEETRGITCWIEQEVLDRLPDHPPTEEGDQLFYVEGVGRIRWSINEGDEFD